VHEYNITLDPFLTLSLLIGILPLGSVFGAIATKLMIKKLRRLTGMYIFTLVNIGAIVLVNITTLETLVVGRFIEGICVGYYTAISPLYLKEIAPK
jgi:MFS family permease